MDFWYKTSSPMLLMFFFSFQVQVCLTGRANTLTEKVTHLQNAAFGYVLFPLIPLDSPFCDIDKNTCTNMEPACGPDSALQPGQEFCTCSNIAVPGAALPGVSWVLPLMTSFCITQENSSKQ